MHPSYTAQIQAAAHPLEIAGLTPDQAAQLVLSLSPLIEVVFANRVRSIFTADEINNLNQLGPSLSPADSISRLEDEYYKKTNQGFLDLHRQIVEELVTALTSKSQTVPQ